MIESTWPSMMLAQEAAPIPPVPGESATTGSQPGAPANSSGTAAPSLFGMDFLLVVMLLVVGMVLLSMMGQRRERRKREAMISAVKKHDRVQTIGGVIGSVVEVRPEYIVLKVDESSNTRITFSRSAVQQVLSTAPEPPKGSSDSSA